MKPHKPITPNIAMLYMEFPCIWYALDLYIGLETEITWRKIESNYPPFIEPEGSSLGSQEPAIGPCPEPNESSSHPYHLL